ncbi:MAG TPA: T9SS type A sorting domain-containing protein [Chitinophagaceae bacterium]|nr:T9SS type A sorting domain-containing protein [Chitinophagaceae bacterium]
MTKKIIAGVIFLMFLVSGSLYSQKDSLLSFDVQPGNGNTVLIEWRVFQENDTLPFEVERSADNNFWKRIAIVPSQLSKEYTYIDRQPEEGFNFYRVRKTGGSIISEFSLVNWVQITKTGKLYIWPNPTRDILHVRTSFLNGLIDVVDSEGKLVLRVAITNYITDVPTTRMSRGIYFLYVKFDDDILAERFVKE